MGLFRAVCVLAMACFLAPDSGAQPAYPSRTVSIVVPALKRNLPFDATKSFTPVALAATSALPLVEGTQVPTASGSEFIALAKKGEAR